MVFHFSFFLDFYNLALIFFLGLSCTLKGESSSNSNRLKELWDLTKISWRVKKEDLTKHSWRPEGQNRIIDYLNWPQNY